MTSEMGVDVTQHVTITGTRSSADDAGQQLSAVFDDYLRPFAGAGATFYVGGAAGIDTAALTWLAANSEAFLVVVVPCTVADQPAAAGEAIRRLDRGGRLVEVVELRADELGVNAFHARNRWMVDRSGFVIGFPRGTDHASGTWFTLNYAAEQGKPRLIVPV